MLKFASDENLNNNIVRGLLRKKPDLDIVRIQDVGLIGADDPTVLEWAAGENRVLITHDVASRPELIGGGLIRSLGGWTQVLLIKRAGG
jgi:hypothetical protein